MIDFLTSPVPVWAILLPLTLLAAATIGIILSVKIPPDNYPPPG